MTLDELRIERNNRLAASDFLLLPDIELSTGAMHIIKQYREDLRNLPEVYADMTSSTTVVWPVIPVELGGDQPVNAE